jgi:hypothetical protein
MKYEFKCIDTGSLAQRRTREKEKRKDKEQDSDDEKLSSSKDEQLAGERSSNSTRTKGA